VNLSDSLSIGAVVFAILMSGSGQIRLNLLLYSLQTILITFSSITHPLHGEGSEAYIIGFAMLLTKAFVVPFYLSSVAGKINATADPGVFVPIPASMHLSILLLGLSGLLAQTIPHPLLNTTGSATAGIALLLIGLLFMLCRRTAVSQIVGFLTLENGIFVIAFSQTRGMPLIVEMGVLLDVLAAVMMSGLLVFRIKKSFEHIDVTLLDGFRER
jgi:hydrogenase-4 component E